MLLDGEVVAVQLVKGSCSLMTHLFRYLAHSGNRVYLANSHLPQLLLYSFSWRSRQTPLSLFFLKIVHPLALICKNANGSPAFFKFRQDALFFLPNPSLITHPKLGTHTSLLTSELFLLDLHALPQTPLWVVAQLAGPGGFPQNLLDLLLSDNSSLF